MPLTRFVKISAVFFSLSFFFLGSFGILPAPFVMAPTGNSIFAAQSEEERRQLEAQLANLEAQIAEQNATLQSYKKQGKTLKSEIDSLNAKIAKLNLQIKAINLTISELDNSISLTRDGIKKTESNISDTKDVISKLLQDVYENENLSTIQVFFQNPKLSDFFSSVNDVVTVQDNLQDELKKVLALRADLMDKQETLSLERSDAASLKAYQDSQRSSIQQTKSDKDSLLKVTKGQESKYQDLLTQTQKAAADIRNRIFRLLGGGEISFGEAVKIAKVAERSTGVRAALILATLTQESAEGGVIGRNLGRCFYNDPRANQSGTVMSNAQKDAFLAIMTELKLDPAKTPVSCPIVSDGAYGGAMGPAQFMPNTWQLYKDRVAAITGGNPASPFNNLDAFTATALYLSGGLEGCRASFSSLFSQESCAAAKYYAGGKWRSYMSVGRYGYRVADRAQGFEADIEVLDNNN